MRRTLIRIALIVVTFVVALLILLPWQRPSLTERRVRDAIYTTIQSESPAAFLVTGQLEITATTRVENTRILLPGIVGLDLGTTRSTVRVPGRVSYGFPMDSLRPSMIRMLDDGSIQVELPALAIYSVEPRLRAMEVETTRGWARLGSSEDEVERRAVAIIEGALARQGRAHLENSMQPRIHAAEALERMLRPVLIGLGMEDPKFRFRIGNQLVVEPTG